MRLVALLSAAAIALVAHAAAAQPLPAAVEEALRTGNLPAGPAALTPPQLEALLKRADSSPEALLVLAQYHEARGNAVIAL